MPMTKPFRNAIACVLVFAGTAMATEGTNFSGAWSSSFGTLVLDQKGISVTGIYAYSGATGTISGNLRNDTLFFGWTEYILGQASGTGRGFFVLEEEGQAFSGQWGYGESSGDGGSWEGTRIKKSYPDFTGSWNTTFGQLVLEQMGKSVKGEYFYADVQGTLSGKVENDTLYFGWMETRGSESIKGQGFFLLGTQACVLMGMWGQDNKRGDWTGGDWVGTRVVK